MVRRTSRIPDCGNTAANELMKESNALGVECCGPDDGKCCVKHFRGGTGRAEANEQDPSTPKHSEKKSGCPWPKVWQGEHVCILM